MRIKVGISNRHIHLKEETYKKLFGNKVLEKRNDLNQIGEFASTETVALVYKGKKIENVRVLGPHRKYNQVELLKSDIEYLGMDAPVRRSSDIKNTPGIIVVHEDKVVTLPYGCIRAERHVHVPRSDQDKYGLYERDKVIVRNDKVCFDANVKVSTNGYFEVHIDKDEAKEYGLKTGDEMEVLKCGK